MAEKPAATPETLAEIALVEFQEQAQLSDKLVTAMLTRIGMEFAPDGQDQAFVSATISGAIMALVRYYGSVGRELGGTITPRMIVVAFTPCLHRSAEAFASEVIGGQSKTTN